MDKLQEMMDKQDVLQNRLGTDLHNITDEERTKFIKEHVVYMNNEVSEMLEELPFFKPWKDYSKMTVNERADAFERARKEYVDVTHFFINIGLALGFNSTDLHHMYVCKNEANHKRQDDGYDHTQRHLE